MAIIYSRHDCRIGLFEQTVWGTGAVNASAVYEIANVPVGIDPDGRMRRPPRGYSSNDGGVKTGQRVAGVIVLHFHHADRIGHIAAVEFGLAG